MNIKRSLLPRNPSKVDTFRRWPFSLPRDRHRIDRASYTVHSQPRGEFGSFNASCVWSVYLWASFVLSCYLYWYIVRTLLSESAGVRLTLTSAFVTACLYLYSATATWCLPFLFILIDRSAWNILHWLQPSKTRHGHTKIKKNVVVLHPPTGTGLSGSMGS